ncbi:DNA-binding CsgD family transcriptional regulator [Kitasatospora sp. MAA4]|uniref:helix-turn-helix domain-containing protein n=1 Tax=Kitasatospora sp. MAA4 TaxID=3035093 RepID=UPI002473D60A|nr:helix-turn-helix transcriptional regulator [Kitasatospora sp. MAA4]MDH6135931.1 DNA-binding CsgD family transcriptional regulator [Kitasatospora sp. MAA4]
MCHFREGAQPGAETSRLLRLLSPREAQALARLVAGDDTRAIAEALDVAPSTARTHLHRAMRKLGVRTRAEAAALLAPPAIEALPPTREGFESLYAQCHDDLVQQTFLLTAGRRSAAQAVRAAFGSAWNRWPEVCAAPDPESWVRARAFDAALSPRHRVGPQRTRARHLPHRRIRVDASEEQLTERDRALLRALLRLSRPRRRDLVLHDALGLPPAAVAAEVQSTTAGVEDRVRAARAELARSVPELVGADPQVAGFGRRLGGLLYRAAVRGCPAPPQPAAALVRTTGRLRAAALPVACGLLVLATAVAVGASLDGNGPSTFFARSHPLPVCTRAWSGSAGPAAFGGAGGPGVRSAWCGSAPASTVLASPALTSPADSGAPSAVPSPQAPATVAADAPLPLVAPTGAALASCLPVLPRPCHATTARSTPPAPWPPYRPAH